MKKKSIDFKFWAQLLFVILGVSFLIYELIKDREAQREKSKIIRAECEPIEDYTAKMDCIEYWEIKLGLTDGYRG